MIGLALYLAVGFGATLDWLLYRNAVSAQAPICWRALVYTFVAWPLALLAVLAMLCSRRVKAGVRRNLGAP